MEDDYLDNLPLKQVQNLYFQQDEAPTHNVRNVDNFLTETFQDRWMENTGPIRWPARSPDMKPLDYFLRGFVKDNVYFEEWRDKEPLKERVREICISLNPQFITNATQGIRRRAEMYIQQNGDIFENLL